MASSAPCSNGPWSDAELAAALAVHDGMKVGSVDGEQLASIGDGLEAGLRVQLAVLDRWQAEGERLGGWKVGLTSRLARDSMGVGFRPFGYIRANRVFTSGTRFPEAELTGCSVEPELCWLVAEPLSGESPSLDDVRGALGGVSPAFEIVQQRLPVNAPKGVQLADDLKNWGIVVGPSATVPLEIRPCSLVFTRDDETLFSGCADDIDDHYLSLSRLCTLLARFGLGLEPGQRVITGSLTAPSPVAGASRFTAAFEGLGDVELTIGAAST